MSVRCNYLDHYQRYGYAIVKCVFTATEIQEIARAFDRVCANTLNRDQLALNKNPDLRFSDDPILGRILRIARWPSRFDDVFDRYRVDQRLFKILEPLIGPDIKQVVNQLHWKPPGAVNTEFGYHQDIGFRRPLSAYRNPKSSYVQTAIAIDPHQPESGTIRVYPGSQRIGHLVTKTAGPIMESGLEDKDLEDLDLAPEKLVDLILEPGDVAFWNLFTIHGSGRNTSRQDRRTYINGYVRASDCDLGEWAFRAGQSVYFHR